MSDWEFVLERNDMVAVVSENKLTWSWKGILTRSRIEECVRIKPINGSGGEGEIKNGWIISELHTVALR